MLEQAGSPLPRTADPGSPWPSLSDPCSHPRASTQPACSAHLPGPAPCPLYLGKEPRAADFGLCGLEAGLSEGRGGEGCQPPSWTAE